MDWQYEDGKIFYNDNNELMAEVTYIHLGEKVIDIDHVYVNPKLRGQGVAGKAMIVAVEFLRGNNLKAKATCSYAHGWFEKNFNEYKDVIADGFNEGPVSCKIGGRR